MSLWTRPVGRAATGVLVVSMALVGCGRRESRPKAWAADVRGRVFLDAMPLAGGTITFLPEDDGDSVRPGVARIGEDGAYAVGNANKKEPTGLPPGNYRVTILRMQPNPHGNGRPIAEMTLPAHYADELSTPLRAVVNAGDNRIEFRIDSQTTPPAAKLAAHD